jgi:hypothetical protein
MNYEYSNLTDVRLIKKVLPIFLSRIDSQLGLSDEGNHQL